MSSGPPGLLSNLWLLLRKELHVGLRSASLYLLVGIPLGVSLLMRVVLSDGGVKAPRLAVVGPQKPALVSLVSDLGRRGPTPLRIVNVKDEAEGQRLLSKGKLKGLLVLDPSFDEALAAGERPRAVLYFDETGGSSAYGIRTIVRELFRLQAHQKEPARLEVRGIRGITPWQAMLPAWVVMVLLSTITLMPTSLATERQTKTLHAVLVTPIGLGELVGGKCLYGVVVGTLGGVAVLAANGALMGNLPLVLVLLILGSAVATLVGILIGLLIESPQGASGVATGLYIPLLWGAFFADLGGAVGAISRVTPSHHLAEGLRHALYSDGTFVSQWPALAGLGTGTLVLAFLGIWALRRAEQRT